MPPSTFDFISAYELVNRILFKLIPAQLSLTRVDEYDAIDTPALYRYCI